MDWPVPFMPIDQTEDQRRLEAELTRELRPSHSLFGVPMRAIGRRPDQDDVLFALSDGTGRVAEVRLTWAAHEQPPWPHVELFDDIEHWMRSRRKADY